MGIREKLLAIQQEVKSTKSQYNDFGKYSYRSAEGIIEDIKPILSNQKVCITLADSMEAIGSRVYVKATATLIDTESIEIISVDAYAREAEAKKGMDEAQITGAASSYARKYALSGLLLLDDNKDADSNEYTAKTQEKGNSAPKKATSKPAPIERFKCSDCGGFIEDHQGVPASKIAEATKKKYGKMICMDCSAKRRAEAEKQKQEDEANLPFDLYES